RDFCEQLFGLVGHDLRNPLSAIALGAGVMLKRGSLDEEQRQTAGRITSSAIRMAHIIEQVLDFTLAQLGDGIPIQREPADLETICRRVIGELKSTYPRSEIVLVTSGDLSGQLDPQRMAQVVAS